MAAHNLVAKFLVPKFDLLHPKSGSVVPWFFCRYVLLVCSLFYAQDGYGLSVYGSEPVAVFVTKYMYDYNYCGLRACISTVRLFGSIPFPEQGVSTVLAYMYILIKKNSFPVCKLLNDNEIVCYL